MESKIIKSDVLIIGSGGAGCRAAIEVSNEGKEALIVSKGLSFRSGCTGMAEGGYNAALGLVDPEDTIEAHIKDTLKGGAYLNDPKLVDILVNESPKRLSDLEEYGALFDRQESGELNQRPFGGQTYRRTCFQGDRTGHEIMTALKEEILKRNIKTMDEVMITQLILDPAESFMPKVIGAVGLDLKTSETIFFQAKAVILASGGAGQLYPVSSNTTQKNGDGLAIAWNAGADLIDMEEVQFHPTGMVYPDSRKGVLVTEAVRAEGGKLINSEGERFMGRYDDRMELATRDVVARSIYNEIMEGRGTEHGGVYLDVTHLDGELIEEKLETMLEQFLDVGVDIRKEPMEVAPTAHHHMGGLRINPDASTNVENLFGAGEVCGGVHGANRLGGNALADTQVFGKIAGSSAASATDIAEFRYNNEAVEDEENRIKSLIKEGSINPLDMKKEIQNLMWEKVSIVRNEQNLKSALERLLEMKNELNDLNVDDRTQFNESLITALEVTNMVEICILIVKSAILRRESRGAHFREDFPETNDTWKKSIVMSKSKIRFAKR
ncbi:succinate dehydrogenase/fumarate reductase flavoprotein subunit SdhA [Methanobrevibacter ruminantium M1]|uniref:Succinate dehydrogenase/fumarate reductase flavoprotein subunit SdhA n=1 Tax=Methanobrevibacter ruminantium (strain ATCC 35063 / DSM 1093 / JCM 13430 / OCM 146 / M1) TaxID=634498 RepID=D3DYM0_METRM|nr:fumarate reductase (CoM/CoB) subunit TfrA [Methanobrevibacter ruminantium]ADC45940.1 succinate dehydrogenase/fumarate reductase flavoprotein subunit SdhA [Methanobrevibacter ruminantium M1]